VESIAIKVCIRLSADYGLCRSELLFKRLRCNVEQASRLTAESERGDAAGFRGGRVCDKMRSRQGIARPLHSIP